MTLTESLKSRHPAFCSSLLGRSKSNAEPGTSRAKIPKINIEFTRRRVKGDVDTVDASYKINIFLEQFVCHFTQKLTYEKKNIQSLLDALSMECSIIPPRCRGAYYNLIGYFYSSLEKHEKADRYFDMALKLNPDDTVAYVNKARNYLNRNDIMKIYPLIRRLTEIKSKSAHLPGSSPLSIAQNTIALAYNKLGLSCAAVHYYDLALKTDPLNFDNYLGKGEVLVKLSKHQGRANALETLQDGIACLRKYIGEFNVLNLANEKDARESPLPRDNKAIKNIYAVILLARALNTKSRKLGQDYTTEALDYMELVLSTDKSVYVLYELGDEKRLMGELTGEDGALSLLREAIGCRESSVVYHSYALALLRWERFNYEERFRVASHMTSVTSPTEDMEHEKQEPISKRSEKKLSPALPAIALPQQEPETPAPNQSLAAAAVLSKMFGPKKGNLAAMMAASAAAAPTDRKKSIKHHSSKSDKPKPFVFEGDDELKEGIVRVAKLLKHALKVSYNGSTAISLDLAEIHCSLNRKSEAEAMFRNVMQSNNVAEKELAFRKFGRFMIKIGDFEKGDEMIEEALKLRTQVNHDDSSLKQLEDTVVLLADHFANETNGKGKYWSEQLGLINPELLEDHGGKHGPKSSRERRR